MRVFRPLADAPEPERLIPLAVPWVYDAGGAYFDSLFGGPESALSAVGRWMARDDSELSIRRVTLLLEDDQPVGGFLALDGAELLRCRKADALAAMRDAGREGRVMLRKRWQTSSGLRGTVEAGEFYLSKMGVLKGHRGRGLGRALAVEYLESGKRRGAHGFRLDVDADNQVAVALYTSLGFHTVSESASDMDGRRLLSMARGGLV